MNVPFVDLKTQYQSIRDEIKDALDNILENTAFILGKEVQQFEEEFANYQQSNYAVAVNSGTSALHLALLAAGIRPGDEVITVPNTFIATVEAILYAGAVPKLVDVDPNTYNMDANLLEQAITSKTKAILPVHLYGQPVDMGPISDIARKHNLTIIEDACQAHGAMYRSKKVGALGQAGCFSFYPGKNLGAYGEGGMVTTDDEAMYQEMRVLRDHGSQNKYHHIRVGYNYRLSGFQGAVLRVKLKYLDKWTEARRRNAAYYDRILRDFKVTTPGVLNDVRHVYHLYITQVDQRDELQQFLQSHGVATGLHYPVPVHLQEGYQFLGYHEGDFPVTEQGCRRILSLPMFPELTEQQMQYVAQKIGEFQNR
ncbi:DegT/DnrJ/EryC1/StrS family aminotransferase [candidate division KSB1 bacterium]|nr:DegT/DnrJ/EryC1/StrS family aminotransferase [candidate division KSB1 bacterium]